MEKKFGLSMTLPENKLPGFYAQIVKGIAERAPLYDRHKELLIFDKREHLPSVEQFLTRYNVAFEPRPLLELPENGVVRTGLFDDYGFESRAGNAYLDLTSTALFRLAESEPDASIAPARWQLEEHLVCSIETDGRTAFAIDGGLQELADRIARAYGCRTEWLDE